MSQVRLLLDVDGVLNAVCAAHPPLGKWDKWYTGTCNNCSITYASGVAKWIRSIDEAGVEIVWLTTWEDLANEHISPFLEIGQYRVAPRVKSSQWWKLTSAQILWNNDQVPFIWIDDELDCNDGFYNASSTSKQWLETLPQGSYITIAPFTEEGLMPTDIVKANEFLNSHGLTIS